MKLPYRTKAPKRAAVLAVLFAAVCAASVAYAVATTADRGMTSDAVLCFVIAGVSAVCISAIVIYLVRFGRTAKEAMTPVYYTMVAGPDEEAAEKPVKIKGKMPPKDH